LNVISVAQKRERGSGYVTMRGASPRLAIILPILHAISRAPRVGANPSATSSIELTMSTIFSANHREY
jgi:hypothetical protein